MEGVPGDLFRSIVEELLVCQLVHLSKDLLVFRPLMMKDSWDFTLQGLTVTVLLH